CPPRNQTSSRCAASTVIAVSAAWCALSGVQKYPLVAVVPLSQNRYCAIAFPSGSVAENQSFTRCHSLWCRLWSEAVTTGTSLCGLIANAKTSDAVNRPSPAVTLSAIWPLKLAGGVPEKVRVAALKVSQPGSALPSPRLAV